MTSQHHFTLSNERLLQHISHNCTFCLCLWKMKSICYSCPSSLPLYSSSTSSAAEQGCPSVVKLQTSIQCHAYLSLLQHRSPVCPWHGECRWAWKLCLWGAATIFRGQREWSGGKLSVCSVPGFMSCCCCYCFHVTCEDQSRNCCLVSTSKALNHHVDKQRHSIEDVSGCQTLRHHATGKELPFKRILFAYRWFIVFIKPVVSQE